MKLLTSDRHVFDVDSDLGSGTIRRLREEIDGGDDVIPLFNIDAHVMALLIEIYGVKDDDTKVAEFYHEHRKDVCALLQGAEYLDMDEVLDALCKSIADQLRGKSVSEMRAVLGVEDDLGAEQIRLETDWIKLDI